MLKIPRVFFSFSSNLIGVVDMLDSWLEWIMGLKMGNKLTVQSYQKTAPTEHVVCQLRLQQSSHKVPAGAGKPGTGGGTGWEWVEWGGDGTGTGQIRPGMGQVMWWSHLLSQVDSACSDCTSLNHCGCSGSTI